MYRQRKKLEQKTALEPLTKYNVGLSTVDTVIYIAFSGHSNAYGVQWT